MTSLYLAREIRALEARAPAGVSLMERAGRAVAELASGLAAETGEAILVVAGEGNNGGDAWVAADRLRESFHRVTVLDAGKGEPAATEARAAKSRFVAGGGEVVREWPERLQPALIIDGLLGIGLSRDVQGRYATHVDQINHANALVLAIDVPSGLDANTGAVRGSAVRADHTITFLAAKPGLYTGDGLDHAGQVHVDTLGITPPAETLHGTLLSPDALRGWLAPRSRNSHKGSFRTLGVVGGTRGMAGAALIAARAGLFAGAGKVYVGLLAETLAYDPGAPELMLRSVDDTLEADVIVAGPGAGLSPSATSRSTFERSTLPTIIEMEKPIVLDADALNAIAVQDALQASLQARTLPAILTPHPGEAARLLRSTIAEVQRDRIGAAVALAKKYNAHVVVKGAGSVCATPHGEWSINATGNPGLASGGTGDALAGLIGAMLCQGLAPGRALAYAVCLHGAAADACVAQGTGPTGLTATDVILAARRVLNDWIQVS
ncbi:NAD(P)H-hydrate dehydratase [Usitatibacter palustris]|uniref:Bifunctional NAD(P)H-hydrate repair enzyme n=1 Tax=Usitatibacter palustris TaxID=2732487 RepID=A0A6M4H9A7_9PROT|nr:NAD(P)H-hydrate dehydratase [Usitatibacter palustris]QJR15313.1 Bifunctional NAD(P)H-hydrate repair enzyme Nnr [Usitatibacter palustris]